MCFVLRSSHGIALKALVQLQAPTNSTKGAQHLLSQCFDAFMVLLWNLLVLVVAVVVVKLLKVVKVVNLVSSSSGR